MSKKVRVSKKYNRQKTADAVLSEELKGVTLCHTPLMKKHRCEIYKNGARLENMSRLLVSALDMRRLNWSVVLIVACRSWDDKDYITTLQIDPKEPRTREQLSDVLMSHHEVLRDSVNNLDFICTAWIASPLPRVFEDDEIYEMLKKEGVFNFANKRDEVTANEL